MRDTMLSALLWFLPLALALHVVEEFAFPGGLKRWITTYKPRKPKGNMYYVVINALGILYTLLIALSARDALGFSAYVAFAATMATNAVSHIRATIQNNEYCPGVISGTLCFLPLLPISAWYLLATGRLDWLSTVLNVAIGAFLGFVLFGVDVRKADRACESAT